MSGGRGGTRRFEQAQEAVSTRRMLDCEVLNAESTLLASESCCCRRQKCGAFCSCLNKQRFFVIPHFRRRFPRLLLAFAAIPVRNLTRKDLSYASKH